MADTRHDLGAVLLDLHAAAAAVALLAAPQLVVDGFQRYRYAGGQPGERRHETLAMRLSGRLKAQHRMRIFIVPDSNNYLAVYVIRWWRRRLAVVNFLLWCILLVLCWPLALIALVLYPLVWLLLLPFRLLGVAVGGALSLVWALVTLPARVLRL
jgi:hypothetical protein